MVPATAAMPAVEIWALSKLRLLRMTGSSGAAANVAAVSGGWEERAAAERWAQRSVAPHSKQVAQLGRSNRAQQERRKRRWQRGWHPTTPASTPALLTKHRHKVAEHGQVEGSHVRRGARPQQAQLACLAL